MTRLIEIECFTCKTVFGMGEAFYATAREGRERITFYCPHGHSQCFVTGLSETERLRKQLETQKQQNAMYADEARRERARREMAERSAAAYKGVSTRLKRRAANGVCPCCNRTFANLQKHMATKHAGFVATDEAEGATIQ